MAGTLNFRRHRILYFLLIVSSVPHKENYSSFKITTSHTDISNGFEQSRRGDLLDFLRGWEGIQVNLTFWRKNRAFCKTSKRGSTCLAIPGHDPSLDITFFHDIPKYKNPGATFPQDLNFSAICNNEPGSNLHVSSEGRAPMITYSREQLLHLRSSSNVLVCTMIQDLRDSKILRIKGKT